MVQTENRLPKYFFPLILGSLCLLYSLARFPGLESHPGYFGTAYRIIFADSFPGDDFINMNQPAVKSLYTVFVKLVGPMWLDDRVCFLFYLVFCFICFWGTDKIIQLFGIKDWLTRIGILSVLLVNHTFISNVPELFDSICIRPSTFAYPPGIWLAFFILSGRELVPILTMSFLIVGSSLKNGWNPAFVSIVTMLKHTYGWRWKGILKLIAAGLVVMFGGYYAYASWKGLIVKNAWVFDFNLKLTENAEAHPFMDGAGPFFFLGMLFITYKLKFKDSQLTERLRTMVLVSTCVYLGGGLYYSLTPDIFKFPVLTGFAVSRSTWWIQIVSYMAMCSYLMLDFEQQTFKNQVWRVLGLLFLYNFPFQSYYWFNSFFDPVHLQLVARDKQMLYLAVCLIAMTAMWFSFRRWGFFSERKNLLKNVALTSVILCTTIMLFRSGPWRHLDDLKFLVKTGVLGGTHGARFVGINEFVKAQLPKDSKIIAFSHQVGDLFHKEGLYLDTALRIRSGMTMPVAHEINVYTDYDKIKLVLERFKAAERFARKWEKCETAQLNEELHILTDPDYLIVPTDSQCKLEGTPFVRVTEINNYVILKLK